MSWRLIRRCGLSVITSKKNPRFTRIYALDKKPVCLSSCVKQTIRSQIIVEPTQPRAGLQDWLFQFLPEQKPEHFRNFNLFQPLKLFSAEKLVSNQSVGVATGAFTGNGGGFSGLFGRDTGPNGGATGSGVSGCGTPARGPSKFCRPRCRARPDHRMAQRLAERTAAVLPVQPAVPASLPLSGESFRDATPAGLQTVAGSQVRVFGISSISAPRGDT